MCGGPAEDRAVRAPSGTGGVPISAWAPARSARSRQVQYPRQREQAILRFPPAKVARRTAVEGDLLAANDHLDYYQLSCLAVRTLHPDLLPVSPGVECRPPAGHPVRNRKTATDCIGRSMWGALGARRLLAAISPFWLLVRGWPSSAPPRCGVRAQAPRRPHQLGRHQLRRLHLCRHARLNCPGRLRGWRTRLLGGRRRTSLSAPSGCRRDARRAASAPPCRSRRRPGHQARRSELHSRTRARRRVPWRSQDEHS